MYEHIFMENINNLYKSSGNFDNQQQYKSIIEAYMVSTPEVFAENTHMPPCPYATVKNPSARKPLHQYS